MDNHHDYKLITAILPKGVGLQLINALKEDKDIITANLNFARGVGRMAPLRFRGVGEQSEKEVVSVIVPATESEDVYEFIYDRAGIDNPRRGLMYMIALGRCNEYTLPEDMAEEE